MKKSGLWFVVIGACCILIGLVSFALINVGPFASKKSEKPAVTPAVPTLAPLPSEAPGGADKDSIPIQKEYKDPVCGRYFTSDATVATSVYMGRTFYFDSLQCKKTFDESPLKYIPIKIKVKIDPGATVDESPGPVTTIKPSAPPEEDYWEENTPPPSPGGENSDDSGEDTPESRDEPQSTP
jgi:Cu+-exporting ATPase